MKTYRNMRNAPIATDLRTIMNRLVSFCGLLAATILVSGCDRTRIERTEVGRIMVVDTRGPADERFGDAVFSIVQGQTRAEAVATLTADDATCLKAVCTWGYANKIGLRDTIGFGPGYGGRDRTSDGRKRTEYITYEAKLGAPVINDRSQISARIVQGIVD